MQEIVFSKVIKEYYDRVKLVRRVLDAKISVLERSWYVVKTDSDILHGTTPNKSETLTIEKGIVTDNINVFYDKSEKFDGIYYRVIKDYNPMYNVIYVTICFSKDLIVLSDNKVFFNLIISEDKILQICCTDNENHRLFHIYTLWSMGIMEQLPDNLFSTELRKLYLTASGGCI